MLADNTFCWNFENYSFDTTNRWLVDQDSRLMTNNIKLMFLDLVKHLDMRNEQVLKTSQALWEGGILVLLDMRGGGCHLAPSSITPWQQALVHVLSKFSLSLVI